MRTPQIISRTLRPTSKLCCTRLKITSFVFAWAYSIFRGKQWGRSMGKTVVKWAHARLHARELEEHAPQNRAQSRFGSRAARPNSAHTHTPRKALVLRESLRRRSRRLSPSFGVRSEFSRYDRALANLERHPHAPAARTAKNARPAVQNARSMGRVDRHDVRVKSPERRRALARADMRLRERRAAHEATCAASLSSHYSPRAARHIPKHSRAARLPSWCTIFGVKK